VGNRSTGGNGGGINSFNGTTTLTNTLVAGNTGHNPDINGVISGTHNLIGDGTGMSGVTDGTSGNLVGHPALTGPLGTYGGPTQTIPLLPGSPAIDAGTATGAPATDQRGKPRVNAPDIGAFESQASPSPPSRAARRSPLSSAPSLPTPSPSPSPPRTRANRSMAAL
jgi:hypothetical protein